MNITTLTDDISLKRQLESGNEEQLKTVRQVISDVRTKGDQAIKYYSEKWDGFAPENLKVSVAEMDEAVAGFDAQLYKDLQEAADNIRLYHKEQKRDGYKLPLADGSWLGQRITPLDAVGLYVPGGQRLILPQF